MGPALAESWEESEDGLTYEFKLRPGLTFHNGDPLTTEDVEFSFDRYQGAGATVLKQKVAQVEIVDPRVIRFHLKEIWPDFMTFYGSTATAAGLVVPKNYIGKVGDDGFKQHPIGAGPYKFVSTKPGIEVVFEAFDKYWRHVPNVKTIVMRSVPDGDDPRADGQDRRGRYRHRARRHRRRGPDEEPDDKVIATKHASSQWIEFPDQYDPKSPWHDERMRRAVAYAIDRDGINKAACLGFCPPAGVIVPRVMEFALQVKPIPYDPEKSKQLLAEAGYPNGIDAGLFHAIPGFPTAAEAVANDLIAVGIRVKLAPMERAAFYADWRAHKFHGLYMTGLGHRRQRRQPGRDLHVFEGRLRLRRLSRYRQAVSRAGRRARREEARGDTRRDPAIDDRPDDVRAGLRFPRADGRRPAHRQQTRSATSISTRSRNTRTSRSR